MNSEQILHDRATRGETLTEEEEQKLATWQAELDRDESMALFGSELPPEPITQNEIVAQLTRQVETQQKLLEEQQHLLNLLMRGRGN